MSDAPRNEVLPRPLLDRTRDAAFDFTGWLDAFGETSQDHQDFFASNWGRRAKALYYVNPLAGKIAVAPLILCEAYVPWTRALFWRRDRLPIADAHYAMAFAYLYDVTGEAGHADRARHFLDVLERTRCPDYERYCWGYPFHWQTQGGTITSGTPLITTTPYGYEAFEAVHAIDPQDRWLDVLRSVAEHAQHDIKDVELQPGVATCTYMPQGETHVVNASAYRACLLMQASVRFGVADYRETAERNLRFVFASQQDDGSWPYAVDGKRDFIDHFHTCFVMKALAKIDALVEHDACREALDRAVPYYLENLFDDDGMPRPFSKAPRLTVYRNELYDCAECLNLCALLQHRYDGLAGTLATVLDGVLTRWRRRNGSFRSRKLLFGWDTVPMHRWGQSQVFRSLCLILKMQASRERGTPG